MLLALGGRRHRRPVLAVGSDRSSCNHESGLFTVILLLISVFVTGGIHLDGLLDTADAMSSYQERERRLEILKDSHAGAFAVITCVVYFYYDVRCLQPDGSGGLEGHSTVLHAVTPL